jgi:hypothetical protein
MRTIINFLHKQQTRFSLAVVCTLCASLLSLTISHEKPLKTYKKKLYGTIGTLGVTMTLNINEKKDGDVDYTGSYSYNHVGKKITLTGSWLMKPGTATSISLTEKVGGKVTGSFILMPKSYGDYSTLKGTWSNSKKTLNVNLKEVIN